MSINENPNSETVPERKKALALASKFNKVACNVWHDLLWPDAADALMRAPKGNAPFSEADKLECVHALLGVSGPLIRLKEIADGSFPHSAFSDEEERFIEGAAKFIGALITFSNALGEHRHQFAQFYESTPSAHPRSAVFAIVEELQPCLEEIRETRDIRINEHARAKEDIEIIRAANPFGLTEGIELFYFGSIMEKSKEYGYLGKEQSLVRRLNYHLHGLRQETWMELKKSGQAPPWTAQKDLSLDREDLTAFLGKNAPKWRKKNKIKEK